MTNLGKISKPKVASYTKDSCLLVVNIIGNVPITDKDKKSKFEAKVTQYWNQVTSQIKGMSNKLGRISKIFYEYIGKDKEDGLNQVKRLDKNIYKIVKELTDDGAIIRGIEDESLLNELRDWQRCIMTGLSSFVVQEKVFEQLRQAAEKRDSFIEERLKDEMKECETGLIFVSNSKQFSFPDEIETFFIEPPALDDISGMIKDFYDKYDNKNTGDTK